MSADDPKSASSKLSLPSVVGCVLVVAAFLLMKSGAHFSILPDPIRIDRGNRTDEYSWDTLIAMVLLGVGSLAVAMSTEVDQHAPPLTRARQRTMRNAGWIIGVLIWFAALHLAVVLLSHGTFP